MNIFVLSTLDVGIDIVGILSRHLSICGVIGLSKRDATDDISGYRYMNGYCDRHGLDFIEVDSYSLSRLTDKARLEALDIDILVVAGWQRLIPFWLIDRCRICAVGSHGSALGITQGRGRSPQNWALLLGKKEFFISIFQITAGIDAGGIIDTRRFCLSEFDDIKTSYYKVSWLMAHMIIDNIRNQKILSGKFEQQPGEPGYLPQRLPGDGAIDWTRTTRQIYDFVRALTRPYPGAFSYLNGRKLTVWRARPFEIEAFEAGCEPGEVAKVFVNGDILVKTQDSFLLVEDLTSEEADDSFAPEEGMRFVPHDFDENMRDIVQRHRNKYPDLPLSDDILNFIGANPPARPR